MRAPIFVYIIEEVAHTHVQNTILDGVVLANLQNYHEMECMNLPEFWNLGFRHFFCHIAAKARSHICDLV